MTSPKLRTGSKIKPPYPLGDFPHNFVLKVGREIVYHLATNPESTIEGAEWERIFAGAIGAEWKPSNVGLDDVILGVCAWGAKTVKSLNPHGVKIIRLISGRNSPAYSFDQKDLDANPQVIGCDVLKIWNARVESIRDKFSHLRTVVLVKSNDSTEFAVFESETVLYPIDRFEWTRNARGNLEGRETITGAHRFTWQPHGSQFTIIEPVPPSRICFRVRTPTPIDRDATLEAVGFDPSWIEIVET